MPLSKCPKTNLRASIYTDSVIKNLDFGVYDTANIVELTVGMMVRE